MPNLIGHTYEADFHCPYCTARALLLGLLKTKKDVIYDREGNPINPVFDTDEQETSLFCGDCHAEL